jgi:SAM-dependent methyltransferase
MTIRLKSVNDALRSALRRYPAVHSAAWRVYYAAHMPQALVRRPSLIKNYLSNAGDFTGLQIGAGPHQLPGWLKTDLDPNWTTVYLDATKRFPFAGETFDYIVAEHIIEHIPYEDALKMLRECHRVLNKGGVVRISTPNIELTHRLMHRPLAPELHRYVSWSNQTWGGADNLDSAIHVVNRLQHGYGHQFLYARDTLIDAFRRSGFVEAAECTPGMSVHPALTNIDRHATLIGEEFNELESLIIEATK